MWLFTEHGFYSAVEHRKRRDRVIVRCRDRDDADRLVEALDGEPNMSGVQESAGQSDYAFRVFMNKSTWASYCLGAALDVDYDNFKDMIERRLGRDRADLYMRVWSVMYGLQRDELPPPRDVPALLRQSFDLFEVDNGFEIGPSE
jgi:hypothetical protein